MLVAGAGLMTKSFTRLLSVDAGFRPENLVAVMFTINTTRHPQYTQFYRQVIDRVRTVPGVIDAGAVREAPFRGFTERWGFTPPGMVIPAGQQQPDAAGMFISDGYLKTIGARMIEGREFTPQDDAGNGYPIVVNESFVRKYLPGGHAVGTEIAVSGSGRGVARIVGVVADIRQLSMEEPADPTIYADNMLNSRVKTTLVARVTGDRLATALAMREAIWSLDRDQTITSIFTFDDAVNDAVARPRLLTVLLGMFAALGLALGALGIYGVLAYLVNQRQREIGVRLALGAAPGEVSRMIVGRGLLLAGGGVVIGLAGALALGRFLSGVLYGVAPSDPATLVAVVGALATVAWLASWVPARRASRVDPVVALRAD
jgi:predicted permease